MTEKINQNGNGNKNENESETQANQPETSALPNALDLDALLKAQGLNTADLSSMIRNMMSGLAVNPTPQTDEEYAEDGEYEDEDGEYDEDEDEEYEDDDEASVVSRQQDAYQLAQSLLSSPMMAQFSTLMGGPKQTEAERLFNQGKMMQGGGMLDEAAEAFLDVIDADPDHVRAHIALGQVLLTMDKPADALPFLQHATELDPQDASGPLYLGYAYYALEQYEQCVAAFEQTTALDPYNHLALNNLGFAEFLTGRLEAAEQTFVRAGDRGSERAYYNLGMVRLLQNNTDAAWQAYDEAAELDPGGTQIGDHFKDLEKAYMIYPDHAPQLDQAVEKLQARLGEAEYEDEDEEYSEDYDDEADDAEE